MEFAAAKVATETAAPSTALVDGHELSYADDTDIKEQGKRDGPLAGAAIAVEIVHPAWFEPQLRDVGSLSL
ncbi:unnamed protein product [Hyaloperonospora brassicae]|uniref:Uncharacterized protein n=1 Tax=Hyaloperonospora brassicae TaxID=162125 RepID=A0AAV0TYA7_HYABA|nr:unnamed protein product [Hyaloperonospora brassicae]